MLFKDSLQIKTVSIVLLGDFNPVIIQPFWLSSKKLIREQEAQNAHVGIIHNEIVKFELDWMNLEITKSRFEVRSSQEPYFEPMRDLCVSIYELLRETPIKSLGINHLFYYAIADEKEFFELGNRLAPLSNWNEYISNPKVSQLEIIEEKRKDGRTGAYRVRIQPSDQVLSTPYGILININDHFAVDKGESGTNREMISILKSVWGESIKRANEIPEKIWNKIFNQ